METTIGRRAAVLVAAVLMALMLVSGPATAAETYKGKGNGYGWMKNNGGVFPGGGNGGGGGGGCGAFCEPS